MRKITTLAAVAVLALALGACTGPAAQTGSSTSSAPATVPDKPTTAAKSDQGFLQKKVGEHAGIANPDGSAAVDFWITKITIDPKCAYIKRDAGKHTIVMDVTVQTHTAADEWTFQGLGGLINPFTFQTKGADGVSNQAVAGACTTTKRLPDNYAANSKYTGQIEVETTNEHGSLLLASQSQLDNGSGWEWKY